MRQERLALQALLELHPPDPPEGGWSEGVQYVQGWEDGWDEAVEAIHAVVIRFLGQTAVS